MFHEYFKRDDNDLKIRLKVEVYLYLQEYIYYNIFGNLQIDYFLVDIMYCCCFIFCADDDSYQIFYKILMRWPLRDAVRLGRDLQTNESNHSDVSSVCGVVGRVGSERGRR